MRPAGLRGWGQWWLRADRRPLLLALLVLLASLVALTAAGAVYEHALEANQPALLDDTVAQQLGLFRAAGLALSGLLASLAFLLGDRKRQRQLKRAVERRALRRANQRGAATAPDQASAPAAAPGHNPHISSGARSSAPG
jgi:hypothetical protein